MSDRPTARDTVASEGPNIQDRYCQARLPRGHEEVRLEEGCKSDPGRVQVLPLHVLPPGCAAGEWDRIHHQQEISLGHAGHVFGKGSHFNVAFLLLRSA